MTRRDDQFSISGETFTRTWDGERYNWTSSDNRLVCFRVDRAYGATLDGYPATKTFLTLTAAMVELVRSRRLRDQRRAA